MGVKSFFHELKVKASRERLFKALVIESHEVLPKFSEKIKAIEIVEGHGVARGCVLKTHFHEGHHFKFLKNRIDEIDAQKCEAKFTLFEGGILGHKFEKIRYELKFEDSKDGGTVIKLKRDFHCKGEYEPTEEEVKIDKEMAVGLYKACDDYLVANPHICA